VRLFSLEDNFIELSRSCDRQEGESRIKRGQRTWLRTLVCLVAYGWFLACARLLASLFLTRARPCAVRGLGPRRLFYRRRQHRKVRFYFKILLQSSPVELILLTVERNLSSMSLGLPHG
jgi:hypothetical protein